MGAVDIYHGSYFFSEKGVRMVPKYNIGDIVQIHARVEAITILKDDIRYRLKIDGKASFIDCDTLYIPEKDIGGKLDAETGR